MKPKPCPFCGSSAEVQLGGFGERFVACTNENCGARFGGGVWFREDADAIAKWNARAEGHSTQGKGK